MGTSKSIFVFSATVHSFPLDTPDRFPPAVFDLFQVDRRVHSFELDRGGHYITAHISTLCTSIHMYTLLRIDGRISPRRFSEVLTSSFFSDDLISHRSLLQRLQQK